jgi:hypothetical protein
MMACPITFLLVRPLLNMLRLGLMLDEKDVDEVVATCERAGLARRVARLRPLGAMKG